MIIYYYNNCTRQFLVTLVFADLPYFPPAMRRTRAPPTPHQKWMLIYSKPCDKSNASFLRQCRLLVDLYA